jgi:hypothetical protein
MLGSTVAVLLGPTSHTGLVYFEFTYTGPGIGTSGILTTMPVVPGEYLIAGVSGQRNGSPITAFLYPTTSMPGSLVHISNGSSVDNLLLLPPLQGPFSDWTGSDDTPSGLVFENTDGEFNPFTTNGNTYEYNLSLGGSGAGIPIHFSVTENPEPGPLALIGTDLVGLGWRLGRSPATAGSGGWPGAINKYAEVNISLKIRRRRADRVIEPNNLSPGTLGFWQLQTV